MKQIKLVIFLFLLSSFLKAQTENQNCDTIYLTNGQTYYGKITIMGKRVIKCIKCYTNNPHIVTIYRADIIKVNSGKVAYGLVKSIDTIKCLHIGIIPYQFLTRSSGIYFRYDFKKLSLEYRPTYTYATKLEPNEFSLYHYDNFFFQGLNNSFIFYFPTQKKIQVGLILSYKYWWHGKEVIDNDNSVISGKDADLHLSEIRSTVMNGFGAGLEFTTYQKIYKKFDFNFFWGAALTYFNSYSHVYSLNYVNWTFAGSHFLPSTYPYTETKSRLYFNLTCGFKLGFKKPLKK